LPNRSVAGSCLGRESIRYHKSIFDHSGANRPHQGENLGLQAEFSHTRECHGQPVPRFGEPVLHVHPLGVGTKIIRSGKSYILLSRHDLSQKVHIGRLELRQVGMALLGKERV